MKRLLLLAAIVFLAACSASAKTFDVDISTGRPAASNEAFYHGETIEFRAVRGRTAVTNIEYSCIFYQTNGMDQAWWKTDGLVFHPTNDCGAAAYRFFLEGRDEIGRDWHANGLLRFLPSPGFEPNAIERPVLTLDFANIEVVNPPWSDTDLTPATNYTDAVAGQVRAAIPTNNAQLANGAGYVTKAVTNGLLAVETDPTVPSWAKAESAPLPPDYATVSNRAMSALQSYTETDPTVPSWAKAETRPTYGTNDIDGLSAALAEKRGMTDRSFVRQSQLWNFLPWQSLVPGEYKLEEQPSYLAIFYRADSSADWGEVGYGSLSEDGKSYTPNTMAPDFMALMGVTITKGVHDELALMSDIPDVSAIGDDATNYTDFVAGELSTAIAGKYPASSGEQLAQQVTAIGAHINGEDAKVMVTNYNSSTHLPEAEFDINVSNNWLVVWREMTRWNWFLGDVFDPHTNAVARALASKAEKEYAFFDGVTGEPAPDGFFWISQPRVAICAGAAYQRYVDTAGEVWVLESNGMVADINGTTNGFFRISDDKGNVQFEIVKGDSRTVAAAAGAMTRSSVMGVTHWHTTYMVTNAVSAPKAMFCRDIANPEWYAEDDPGCPCNVDWTHPSERIYVCEWWTQGNEPKMFMRSQYGQGSESRIVQNAPVEMQTIVLGGTKYALGTATIDGKTVLTLSTP